MCFGHLRPGGVHPSPGFTTTHLFQKERELVKSWTKLVLYLSTPKANARAQTVRWNPVKQSINCTHNSTNSLPTAIINVIN